jgi:hypothetical protein
MKDNDHIQVPINLCNDIHSHLNTLSIYLKGEHYHEIDKIQQKEDLGLYEETMMLKRLLRNLINSAKRHER